MSSGGDAWTQALIAISIFVPVVVTVVLAVVILRGSRNDPDVQRLRRAQRRYEATRDRRR
ncbi:MAG TPA: hypothetical protein VGC78_10375 [Gaiellaceae bacterium]|jgi:hypothetical protein